MRIAGYALLLALLTFQNDCDINKQKNQPEQPHPVVDQDRFAARFEIVAAAQQGGGLALDRKTGLLCRTWNWEPRVGPKDVSASTPLCYDLYTREGRTGWTYNAYMGVWAYDPKALPSKENQPGK